MIPTAPITDDVVPVGMGEATCMAASPEEAQRAVQFIALQALGEQRLSIDAQIRRLYRKRDQIDCAIAEAKAGIDGTFHGDGFDIKPRREVKRKFVQLSPSQRRAERRKASLEVA